MVVLNSEIEMGLYLNNNIVIVRTDRCRVGRNVGKLTSTRHTCSRDHGVPQLFRPRANTSVGFAGAL